MHTHTLLRLSLWLNQPGLHNLVVHMATKSRKRCSTFQHSISSPPWSGVMYYVASSDTRCGLPGPRKSPILSFLYQKLTVSSWKKLYNKYTFGQRNNYTHQALLPTEPKLSCLSKLSRVLESPLPHSNSVAVKQNFQ